MQTSNNGKNILHSLLFALDLANRKLDEQFCRKTLLMVDSDDDFSDDLGYLIFLQICLIITYKPDVSKLKKWAKDRI